MSIAVLRGGLLTTIQDYGRYGYQKYGVIVSGVMDVCSMKTANILVGNDENEGVLEMTLMGPSLVIEKGTLICITGGDLSPVINNKPVPMTRPVYINEDCILEFGRCISGCRAYLSVAGGFKLEKIMKSKSTYLRGGFGGVKGRKLKKGDLLEVNPMNSFSKDIINKLIKFKNKEGFSTTKWYARNYKKGDDDYTVIRVFEDREYSYLTKESLEKFFNCSFIIDNDSDRMGYRLNGPKIEFKNKMEMISGEVSFGTIQIPPDGKPIILLADRATVGGYPKIAHVIYSDIYKLVQLKANEKIKFKKITINESEDLYLKRQEEFNQLKRSLEILCF